MKKAGFLLAFFIFLGLPVLGEETKPAAEEKLPSIFIWAIPEDEDGSVTTEKQEKKSKKNEETKEDDVIELMPEEEPIVLKTTTLKGYAEYVEDAEDILYMDDHTKFVLNIKTPEQMASQQFSDTKKIVPDMKNIYSISKFKGEEYSVSPASRDIVFKDGNWSLGTSFDAETTSLTQLENTTSLFAKYENKHFALSSKYKKNNMTVTQIQTDNFSVIPELKFNDIFAIQDVLSTDITRNRRSSELVFSINPLGKKDIDRMRFNVGAKHTYDVNSGNSWSQLEFTTKFKL
ncbi:hypothetical protein DBY21_05750 [Candidatus Gastranaerophilales bacterium]|nr:MAG: hypothetical protein DBY21_05750 [Candidatus Gastranaerophilales bacterium]